MNSSSHRFARAKTLLLVVCAGLSSGAAEVVAEGAPAGVYAPYAFLIGTWDVGPEAGAPFAVTRFRFGPGESYIWTETSLLTASGEVPHFEGMWMWNGVRRNLDMLISLDLEGGRSQESGIVRLEKDGTVVREITATFSPGVVTLGGSTVGPEGATARFRQTFEIVGADRVETAILRQADGGWVASFPGSDRMVMTRRSGS